MSYKLTTYRANGEINVEESKISPKLEKLQKLVGGYIEAVPKAYLDADWIKAAHKGIIQAWCDEEGRWKTGYGINPHFTPPNWLSPLYGDVLIVERIK